MRANALLLVVSCAVAVSAPARADEPQPPDDAKKLLAELDKDVKGIESKARKDLLERNEKALNGLKALQETYAKAGKKDDAAAVAGLVKRLTTEAVVLALDAKVVDDPGTLTGYRGKVDEVIYVRVTGATDGEVWGTGVYTDDSRLAAAAVHAGLLKNGESGIIKVTVLAGQATYTGSTANDVTSGEYGDWEGSYKVDEVKAEK